MAPSRIRDDGEPSNTDAASGRGRVVAHARRLFLEFGYASVSMQQIADAAELRKATLYHHFRDKNALFAAVVLAEVRRSHDALAEIAERGLDLRSALHAMALAYFEGARTDFLRLVEDYRRHIPESEHAEMHAELLRLVQLFEALFNRAAAQGDAVAIPPRIAGAFFFEMLGALLFRFDEGLGLQLPPDEAAALVTSALLDGILTRGRA